jgi:hypothetical protein
MCPISLICANTQNLRGTLDFLTLPQRSRRFAQSQFRLLALITGPALGQSDRYASPAYHILGATVRDLSR